MKKIILPCIIIFCMLLVGCSSISDDESSNIDGDNTYNNYVGTYEGQYDATEKFTRAYYSMDESDEFVNPGNSLYIAVTLTINEDNTYSIHTEDEQILFLFDLFLTKNTVKSLELYNRYNGDEEAYNKNSDVNSSISEIYENIPMSAITFNDSGTITVDGNILRFNNGDALIEYQDGKARLKFIKNNTYTNNEFFLLKGK